MDKLNENYKRFYRLFVNREHRIGLSEPKLKGRERSVVIEPRQLPGHLQAHLTDPTAEGVGCYAADEDGNSWWGCFDFDSKRGDPAVDAQYALTCLRRAGLNGVIEISRSGEGRHVWLFLDLPVPADTLRKALLLVDEAAALECQEINPKQRVGTDHSKNLGNYVRLPYHAKWVPHNRMVCVDDDGRILSFEQFLDYAEAHQVSSARVRELAERYHEKPPPRREVKIEGKRVKVSSATQDAHNIVKGQMIYHEGGMVDGRNNNLWNLANFLAAHPQYNLDEAHALMVSVWENQLDQKPDFISLDVCRSMIDRAFAEAKEESNAQDIH